MTDSVGTARFSVDGTLLVGQQIGTDWEKASFDVEQFRIGMRVELKHGLRDPLTNVSGDDPIVTGKTAPAHLNEFLDYTRLERMEAEAAEREQERR